MNLTCYQLGSHAPELIPARADRLWMDKTGQRFAYRCTPLTMANSTGWELLCPTGLTATWNGGTALTDLVIEFDEGTDAHVFAQSHFGNGVLSFHPGYLFRTDSEWGLICRGAPNSPKDGIHALDGLVETDWLPFTFTMNWLFTRPGSIRFEKGEPFCFILPVPHIEIEGIQPTILPLAANPELTAEHVAWGMARAEFNKRLNNREPGSMKEKWQRFYFNGKSPRNAAAPETHRVKRKMNNALRMPSDGSVVSFIPDASRSQKHDKAPSHPTTSQDCPQNIIWTAAYPGSGAEEIGYLVRILLAELNVPPQKLNERILSDISAETFERITGKTITEVEYTTIATARAKAQQALAKSSDETVFVQTHLCVGSDYLQTTIDVNATLGALYVVRNPLDVAISLAEALNTDFNTAIQIMATPNMRAKLLDRSTPEMIGSWSQHVGSWIGFISRPVHVLRFEDLRGSPHSILGAIARFLNIRATEQQLDNAASKWSSEKFERSSVKHRSSLPASPVVNARTKDASRWRELLNESQINAIVRTHGPMMQRFGYLPANCGVTVA